MGKKRRFSRLDADGRMVIQACVSAGMSLSGIAARLRCSKSTVSREIRRGMSVKKGGPARCGRRRNGLGICNACPKKAYCGCEKRYYDYAAAQARCEEARSAPRSRSRLSPESIRKVSDAVEEG